MDTTTPTIVLFTLLVTIAIAGWPILVAPYLRAVLMRAAGSGCISLGVGLMGALMSGLLPLPAATALAQEPAADETTTDTASAPIPLADATSVKSDPVIETPPDTIEIPPGRPKWVGSQPDLTGKTHKVAVASGPYAEDSESRRALDQEIVKATREYIAEQLGSELAAKLIRYDARTIKKRFLKPENTYHDVARYSVGWMHENFALLEFDQNFRNELDRRWSQMRAKSRLAQTGLASGTLLLLLSSLVGYFRADNATRGYYTGRLQLMTAAAILAIIGAGAVFTRWIDWL